MGISLIHNNTPCSDTPASAPQPKKQHHVLLDPEAILCLGKCPAFVTRPAKIDAMSILVTSHHTGQIIIIH